MSEQNFLFLFPGECMYFYPAADARLYTIYVQVVMLLLSAGQFQKLGLKEV
jgi:hypothetical protein